MSSGLFFFFMFVTLFNINIRKTYLKLTSNLDFYKKRAEQTLEKLQTAYSKIENIESEIKDLKK